MGLMQSMNQQLNYIKVEFLTVDQKKQKDKAIQQLEQYVKEEEEKDDDLEIIHDYESVYKASLRKQIGIPDSKKYITYSDIKQFFDYKQINSLPEDYKEITEFYYQNVHKYKMTVQGKPADQKTVIDMDECKYETPLIEIIYQKRSKFDRFVRKANVKSKHLKKKIAEFFSFAWLRDLVYNTQGGRTIRVALKLAGPSIKEWCLKTFVPLYSIASNGQLYYDVVKEYNKK